MKHLKAIVFCLILMLAAGAALPVFAERLADFDPEKPCSLNVTLTTEDGQKAAGAEIVLVYSIIIMALGLFFIVRPDTVLQLLSTIVGIFLPLACFLSIIMT